MDGVTILQVIETTGRPEWAGLLLFILFVCAVLWGITSLYLVAKGGYTNESLICAGITLLSVLGAILILQKVQVITTITYRVLVDDTVNMNEFLSKYEIVGREGLIYVVRDITGI